MFVSWPAVKMHILIVFPLLISKRLDILLHRRDNNEHKK